MRRGKKEQSRGSVLIGLIIVMVILAVMAAAMVTITSTSTHSYLWTGSGNQARLLAESGYRYSFLKYEGEGYQTDANDILEELNDNEYQLNPTDQDKKFKIEVTSHWFEAAVGAYSASPSHHVDTSTFGDPPPRTLSGGRAGYIKVWEGSQYPRYTSISQVGNLFRFWLTNPITQTTMKQAVYLVCLVQGNHTLSQGSDLPLQYDAATDNGIYLFPDSKAYIEVILAPNDTKKLSYEGVDFATKSLTGLKDYPGKSQFPISVSHGDRVMLWPYFQVDSTGAYRDAQAKTTFPKPFHPKPMVSGPPEAQFDFDDPTRLGKDTMGGADATIHGGVTATTGVRRGGVRLEAAQSGYIEVTGTPGLEVSGVDKVTVQAWVKKATTQQGQTWVAVVQKSDYSYNMQLNDGNIPTFTIWDGVDRNDAAGVWKSAQARFRLMNDVWYLLTGTFDSSATEISQQVYSIALNLSGAERSLGHRRCLVIASDIADFSGGQVRVKFQADPLQPIVGNQRLVIDAAYIGERDGTTWNMKSEPIKAQLTFNGGSPSVTITAGGSAWSDWVSFPVDGTADLLVSYDFGDFPCYPYFAALAAPSLDRFWANTDGAALDTAPAGGSDLTFRAGVAAIEARVGNVKLYVDGMLEGTNSASQIGDATGWNVGIGANLDTGNRFFDGSLDDVRIYSRALASEEILDYYNWYTPK